MKHNREYEIAWQGLKPGEHIYSFEIGDDFMRAHEAPEEFSNWKAAVTLRFDKQNTFFQLHFDIGGSVNVPCDRCGDAFDMPLWDEFDLLVKLTGEADDDHETDDEADVVFVPRSETVIDISTWIYEFVMLSVPLQKVHGDDENGTPGCNPEALRLLNQLSAHEEDSEATERRNDLWKGLQALKNTGSEEDTTDETTTNVNKRKRDNMPNPKRRHSQQRSAKRRTHYKAVAATWSTDAVTGESHLRHRAHWVEGKLYYRGKVVMDKNPASEADTTDTTTEPTA